MVNKKQSIAEARKLLSQFAPEGESLAFINEEEARLLKAHGGSGELTQAGIPTYFKFKNPFKKVGKVFKKVKERVRKIMPNEVAEINQKLAPIVSMFNPVIGAAMSAQASFDKEGSITEALKSGAKTYAIGQVGRVVGGGTGNLQGNPFSASTYSGGNLGFSSPFSTQGGIGSMFKPGGTGSNILDIFRGGQNPMGGSFSDFATGKFTGGTQAGGGGIGSLFGKGFNFLKNNPKLAESILSGVMSAYGQKEQNEENEKFQGPGYESYADVYGKRGYKDFYSQVPMERAAYGGIMGYANGGPIELAYGGRSDPAMEMDYRGGGFIPVGAQERADDVPARLSKNEFVMTADAVRAAGGGSVDVGAQKMYDLMNNLEGQA